MTRKEREMLIRVHAGVEFIINGITVNGDDGSLPLKGLKNILEAHHKNDKIQNKQLAELAEITGGLKAKKKLKESFQTYLDSHPFVKFLLTPNKTKVGIGVGILILSSEMLGFHTLTDFLRVILKGIGWIK